MSLTFDHLLKTVDIKPADTHLVRHQDTRQGLRRSIYALWRDDRAAFEHYQCIQSRSVFKVGNVVASFVVTPQGETLFVGLYEVAESTTAPPGTTDPFSKADCAGYILYTLKADDRLQEYVGKLAIDWGLGLRSWAQRGGRSPKPIVIIRRVFEEERFPGYLRFIETLSSIPNLPVSWRERLSQVKGVYVLTSQLDKALYVGSATGEGGFYERWCQHARKGGDAVHFKDRVPSAYQVSILEVAGSNASDRDIIHAEMLWMQKLQTREMGLNGGTLTETGSKFAISGTDPFYVIQKDGTEVQFVTGEDGSVKRVPVKIPRISSN